MFIYIIGCAPTAHEIIPIHSCIYLYMHLYIPIYRTYMPTYIHTHTHACMHTHVPAYIHSHIHTSYVNTRAYILTYISYNIL